MFDIVVANLHIDNKVLKELNQYLKNFCFWKKKLKIKIGKKIKQGGRKSGKY